MKADYTCECFVDLITWSTITGKQRCQPTACHVTAKRIYSIGGAVFDRATGRQIMRSSDRSWGEYQRKVDVNTIRKTKEPV